ARAQLRQRPASRPAPAWPARGAGAAVGTAPARVLRGRRPRAAGRIRSRAFGAMADGRAAAAAAPRRTLALGAEAGGSAAGPARRGAATRAPAPRDAGRGPGRRARRLDLGAGADRKSVEQGKRGGL